MLEPDDRVLVAVSGGKDSLAVWDILLELGYQADGLYLGLGIGDYSDASGEHGPGLRRRARAAPHRGRPARRPRLRHPHRGQGGQAGAVLGVRALQAPPVRRGGPHAAATTSSSPATTSTTRPPCCSATCCTGRPTTSAASSRCCPARHGFPRKVKPLVRLGEREMAAYCVLRGIDYIVEECPMAAGNKHLGYKEALNAIEATSPGHASTTSTSASSPGPPSGSRPRPRRSRSSCGACARCGAPTTGEVCAFCRLVERAGGTRRPRRAGTAAR